MTLAARHRAVAGILDLTIGRGGVIDCGSISLADCARGEEWAEPPGLSLGRDFKSRPNDRSGTGDSNDSDPVPLAERLLIILLPPLSLCMSASGPLEWPCGLLEFQKDGIHVLTARPSVLLADDMGLGKTVQAAAAMRLLALRGKVERILIVAPAAVLRNWRDELERWAPELRVLEITGSQSQRVWKWDARVHVKIVSYETLRSDHRYTAKRLGQWDLVCLDEAQRIKNSDSAISGVIKSIHSRRRWALTGTPLENSLEDVRSILSFLEPSMKSLPVSDVLGRIQLRRRKLDVLADLPAKMVKELFIPLTRQQREEYDSLQSGGVDDLRAKGAKATVTDVLALINRLKQVCNFSVSGGYSSKLDDIAQRLAALRQEGHKALIFSQFTNEAHGVRRIARALAALGPVIYTGDMSAEQRRQATGVFQRDEGAGVLILSLRAGGVGLNLQQASYVFHFDRWWNPASEAQADDRCHRIGQTRGVSVYKYICENTIEERIHEILRAKRALFTEYVDDVCMDLGERLTEEELFGLFGLQPPKHAERDLREPPHQTRTEGLVRRRLAIQGYQVEITYPSGEGGVDLVAKKTDVLGLEEVLLVRCMDRSLPIELEAVREFGDLLPGEEEMVKGLIACPAGFTEAAAALAKKHHVLLWTAAELEERS